MSGHSKWSQIKRQKGLNDLKKGQIYTKIAKQIALAAKQAGADPETNFSLRMAIAKAKAVNMPSDNILKSIKKGTGEDKGNQTIEAITYEAYGFGGATLLIDVLTDNRNRSAADIRLIIEKAGGKIVEAGALSWQYETLGLITLVSENKAEELLRLKRKWNEKIEQRKIPMNKEDVEAFEMAVFDIDGVKDVITEEEDGLFLISLYTQLDQLDNVKRAIEQIGYDPDHIEIIKEPTIEVSPSEVENEKNRRLIDQLEENDDVDTIWHNIRNL